MKFVLFLHLLFLSFSSFFAQVNLSFQSRVDYQSLHNTELNDIWGYANSSGQEYALVGAVSGTSVVDITNPASPNEVFWLPGMASTWRDLKTWNSHVFVTTEAQQGLTIIDLSPLPTSTNLSSSLYFGPAANPWESAHNLFIDENGYAYIFGANRGAGGVIILDVHTDPMSPIEVGIFDNWYAHDGFVRNDTLFAAHINDGFISVVDVSDKANPVLLGTRVTPGSFAHNVWTSTDGQVAFTTDEKPSAFLAAYDVSNPSNITELDRIQSSPGSGVIPHNVHVLGDFLVTSYYRDGVTIHDISRPNNMVEVGNYDTSPLSGNGFNGCWGVYPFLPSGNVIASDIERGLFVLGATYTKGCYLEGNVTDSATNIVLSDVKVVVSAEVQTDLSKANGNYAVSSLLPGPRSVTFSKTGYASKTITVTLVTAQVINQNIQLTALPPFPLTVKVLDAATNAPVNNANVRLSIPEIEHEGITNALGEEDFTLFYKTTYDLTVGKWGYRTSCQSININDLTGQITVTIEKGIYDDFSFDFGWTTTSNALTGDWVRAIPFGGTDSPNPEIDATYDCGGFAFVTGNLNTIDPDADDVDDGTVVLKSPTFDLTGITEPYVNFSRYFYNFHGQIPDDKLRVTLGNGIVTVLIDEVGSDTSIFYKWITKSIKVSDFLAPTANMVLTIRTSDLLPNNNITEAGFDFFYVTNFSVLTTDEITTQNEEMNIFPNPSVEKVTLNNLFVGEKVTIFNLQGKVVLDFIPNSEVEKIEIGQLTSGVYVVQQGQQRKKFIKN